MEEFEKRLEDYFTSAELVELVDVRVEDVIWMMKQLDYMSPETVEDLEEIMYHGK